jgi:ABC-type lipoprotein export system ATPase subunit
MKVSRIEIKDFQQFKNFELDLTYPEGHKKAGEPLDKVCFIGQSGTGKTTLLNWIWHSASFVNAETYSINRDVPYNFAIDYIYQKKDITNTFLKLRSISNYINSTIYKNYFECTDGKEVVIDENQLRDFLNKINYKKKILAVFFPTNLIENANEIFVAPHKSQNPLANIVDRKEIERKIQEETQEIINEWIFNFGKSNPLNLFKSIFFNIAIYEDERNNYSRKIADALLDSDDETITNLKNKFGKWKLENPNPLEKLGQLLNPILNRFGVEVHTKVEYKSSAELKFIEIKPIHNDKIVPYHIWSTGTKQIILTAIPLFQINTQNAPILFDEPERSLFPDVQRTLINYYTELAPEAQFFFATHSPIIASQFEPCERFILSFDEETGFVKAQNGIAPEGDDPNDLLSKDFGMRNLMGEKGMAAWERFVELRMLIREEKESTKKENLMKEYLTLQSDYNF